MNVCQSCGMPLHEKNKGTNDDLSLSDEYCSYCYEQGEFVIPNLTLDMQIDKLANMAIERMKMPESEARQMAEEVLPSLKRWTIK